MAAAGALSLAAFALYLKTASPTFGGLDAAEFAIAAYTGGIPHATGYPLFLMLGWLFTHALPVGEVVFRTTVMTALFAAGTVGLAFLILRELRLHRLPAGLACATFAISYYQWTSAVATKEHSLHDFLLALLLLLVLKWHRTGRFGWLAAAAGVFGLSLTNHMSAALYAPALALFVVIRGKLGGAQLVALAATSAAGLLPYLYLPLIYLSGPRFNIAGVYDAQAQFHPVNLASPGGMLWMVTGRQFGRLFLSVPIDLLPSRLMEVAYWLWTSFFGAGVVLGIFGLASLMSRNRWFFWLSATLAVSHVAFFATYTVPDRDAMFVPLYLLWTLPLGFGIASLLAAVRRPMGRRWTSALLAAGLTACLALSYPRADRSSILQPQTWATTFLETLPPGTLVIARWETSGPLLYMTLLKGIRPDVQVIDRFLISSPVVSTLIADQLGKRPVVVDNDDILEGTRIADAVLERRLLTLAQSHLSPDDQRSYPGLLLLPRGS